MCRNGVFLRGEYESEILWLRSRCGRYACEDCARNNVENHFYRVIAFIKSRNDKETVYFETYTAHERSRGFEKSLQNLRAGWKKIAQLKRDRYKDSDIWFIKVFEQHADSTLHLHVLTNVTAGEYFKIETDGSGNKQWVANLNDVARMRGLGYMAKAIRLNSRFAAAKYVTKYMVKSAHSQSFPSHFRRIEFSRKIPKLSKKFSESEVTWRAWYQENKQLIINAIVEDTMQTEKIVRIAGKLADVQVVADFLDIEHATWEMIPVRHFFRAAINEE